jgi:phosphatidylserine/phosphatidylglycerophosphate/cardiolipin synthase-like enzyme
MANESQIVQGVEYPRPFDQLTIELVESAARHIYIMSPRLDYQVFDNPDLLRALSALVRRSRQTEVRVLVADSRALVARGHRLVEMSRRLSSSIQIRKLAEHPEWAGETVVIRDRDGVLYKPADANHEAFYQPDSRAVAQQYLEQFHTLWSCSSVDVELRSMRI